MRWPGFAAYLLVWLRLYGSAQDVPICEIINMPKVRHGHITSGRAHAQWNWCHCVVTPSTSGSFQLTAIAMHLAGDFICQASLVVKLGNGPLKAPSFLQFCSNYEDRQVSLAANRTHPVELTFKHKNTIQSNFSIKVTASGDGVNISCRRNPDFWIRNVISAVNMSTQTENERQVEMAEVSSEKKENSQDGLSFVSIMAIVAAVAVVVLGVVVTIIALLLKRSDNMAVSKDHYALSSNPTTIDPPAPEPPYSPVPTKVNRRSSQSRDRPMKTSAGEESRKARRKSHNHPASVSSEAADSTARHHSKTRQKSSPRRNSGRRHSSDHRHGKTRNPRM